ncbi:4-hydroxy-tetrahydrodipicolinate synthase [Undibacterium sp. TJN25]|uniref:4-hydroxy-tetrahydrodipicolinate synthase n=1 Tax=Undibacterium sp. TJN25 TaxID=3413056 RepID=UPI003BF3A433
MASFTGIWVALATPFITTAATAAATTTAAIDIPALQEMACSLMEAGVSGLVVCGSTGEAAALSAEEQLQVLDAVLAVVPADNIVMGLSCNNLQQVLQRLQLLQQRPVAGLLVTPPYYIRPSQAGIIEYFHAIANASRIPIVLYNIPYRTGVDMELDTIRVLAGHERIVAIKDCGGSLQATMQLIADRQLYVLTGEDHQLLSHLSLGGAGAIIASAHLCPELFVRVARLMESGDIIQAREIFYHLLPLICTLFEEPNPAPLKAALAAQGRIEDVLRSPMQQTTPALKEKILLQLALLQAV